VSEAIRDIVEEYHRLRDGRNVEVRFADFFRLGEGRFGDRHTCFFAPSV
jgi:hypothetical protein